MKFNITIIQPRTTNEVKKNQQLEIIQIKELKKKF